MSVESLLISRCVVTMTTGSLIMIIIHQASTRILEDVSKRQDDVNSCAPIRLSYYPVEIVSDATCYW